MRLLFIPFFLIATAYGQKKDSSQHTLDSILKVRQIEAINFTLSDIKQVMYNKVGAGEYESILKLIDKYIDEKRKQFEPKNKKP